MLPTQAESKNFNQRFFIQKIIPNPDYQVRITDTFMGEDDTPEFIAVPVDADAIYFPLRLDGGGDKHGHEASIIAINAYAHAIKAYDPDLANDLLSRYAITPAPESSSTAAVAATPVEPTTDAERLTAAEIQDLIAKEEGFNSWSRVLLSYNQNEIAQILVEKMEEAAMHRYMQQFLASSLPAPAGDTDNDIITDILRKYAKEWHIEICPGRIVDRTENLSSFQFSAFGNRTSFYFVLSPKASGVLRTLSKKIEDILYIHYGNESAASKIIEEFNAEMTVLWLSKKDRNIYYFVSDNTIGFRDWLEAQKVEYIRNGLFTMIPLEGNDIFRLGIEYTLYCEKQSAHSAANDSVEKLQKEIAALKDALHRDQTGLAKALAGIRATLDGYHWVTEGRGPYAFNDDRYKAEMLTMLTTLGEMVDKALTESSNAHRYCCERGPTYEELEATIRELQDHIRDLNETITEEDT